MDEFNIQKTITIRCVYLLQHWSTEYRIIALYKHMSMGMSYKTHSTIICSPGEYTHIQSCNLPPHRTPMGNCLLLAVPYHSLPSHRLNPSSCEYTYCHSSSLPSPRPLIVHCLLPVTHEGLPSHQVPICSPCEYTYCHSSKLPPPRLDERL